MARCSSDRGTANCVRMYDPPHMSQAEGVTAHEDFHD